MYYVANSNFGPGLETAPSFPKLCNECSVSHSGNPAHETYDMELGLISTTGMYFRDERNSILYPSRVVYNIFQISDDNNRRNIFGEIEFEPIDLDRCWTNDHPGPGMKYCKAKINFGLLILIIRICIQKPSFFTEERLRYLHTIASTEHYVIIPETSYTQDACQLFRKQEDFGNYLKNGIFVRKILTYTLNKFR